MFVFSEHNLKLETAIISVQKNGQTQPARRADGPLAAGRTDGRISGDPLVGTADYASVRERLGLADKSES